MASIPSHLSMYECKSLEAVQQFRKRTKLCRSFWQTGWILQSFYPHMSKLALWGSVIHCISTNSNLSSGRFWAASVQRVVTMM